MRKGLSLKLEDAGKFSSKLEEEKSKLEAKCLTLEDQVWCNFHLIKLLWTG